MIMYENACIISDRTDRRVENRHDSKWQLTLF